MTQWRLMSPDLNKKLLLAVCWVLSALFLTSIDNINPHGGSITKAVNFPTLFWDPERPGPSTRPLIQILDLDQQNLDLWNRTPEELTAQQADCNTDVFFVCLPFSRRLKVPECFVECHHRRDGDQRKRAEGPHEWPTNSRRDSGWRISCSRRTRCHRENCHQVWCCLRALVIMQSQNNYNVIT